MTKHNYSTDKHLRQTVRRRLKNGTNSHNGRAHHDCLLPSKPLTHRKSENGPEETTDIVNGCYSGKCLGLGWADEIMEFEEILGYNNATLVQVSSILVKLRKSTH